jgi:response regulator NasT
LKKSILSLSAKKTKNQNITARLKVLLAENNNEKAHILMTLLTHFDYDIYHMSHSGVPMLKAVERLIPDIIIIGIESPSIDMLESLNQISQFAPRPIIMLSEQQNPNPTINQLIKAGVSAYVVDEVDQERLKFLIDVAIARFDVFQDLKQELADTKEKLTSQKNIEKAKHWLMETKQLSEVEAYQLIRKTAMDNSQKMDDVAKNILSVATIF